MGRFVQFFLVAVTIVVSVVVYGLKYDTGREAVEIAGLKHKIAGEKDTLSVLRAEWSLLNQPDRLQRLAEKYLELEPLKPALLSSLNDIQHRPDSQRLEALVLQALDTGTLIAAASAKAPPPSRKPVR